ncbi:hypothetical protein AMD27_16440 (plasmid) [Acinetobacter sp. TGL-Y2]|uniref:hypothetical protein n=1 Tax=Acinetobacter sp. TGL-Y2 TaxID=1407071 RepID=UPI0007A64A6E|nr:hypothetical protein [Acinetobacter sp. TGL-Y2]AMW80504.1 hypothetical protein AMD27_16440 [Acinetobacter sp. TGL-Y2]
MLYQKRDINHIVENLKNTETTHVNRFNVEYKKSSKNPDDLASLLEDDGQSGIWIESKFSNHELDTAIFLEINN